MQRRVHVFGTQVREGEHDYELLERAVDENGLSIATEDEWSEFADSVAMGELRLIADVRFKEAYPPSLREAVITRLTQWAAEKGYELEIADKP